MNPEDSWNWSLVTLIRVMTMGGEPGLTGAMEIRQEKTQSISITCGFLLKHHEHSSSELGPIVHLGNMG